MQAYRDLLERCTYTQIPGVMLEVGRTIQPVIGLDQRVFIGTQQRADLVALPHIKLALLMLRVGIQRRVVSALRGLHFAPHPGGGLFDDACQQRIAAALPSVAIQAEQQAVVVEHFFEVRNVPAFVHAIAAEAATELVIQPAVRHLLQSVKHDVQRLLVAGCMAAAQQQIELRRMQEFRCAAEAAMHAVEVCAVLLHRQRKRTVIQRHLRTARPGQCAGQCRDQLLALCGKFCAVLSIDLCHPF